MPSDTTIPDAARRLRTILTDNVPYCSGTFVGQPRDFLLYYGKAEQVGRIDLANATVDELDRLAEACQPASFGVNQEDVFDESYRKAGKLDVDSFLLGFNADTHTGLLDVVRSGLFPGADNREIQLELYKLNVYGENAFFKSHKDTPRAENMFGSLVIVFPTPHVGGALILRHDGREWVFDSGKLLSDPSIPPSIAYAAFFSDVDHEVTLVESGHRVSATYNLYFSPSKPAPASATAADSPAALRVLNPISENPSEVFNALQALLAEPAFLPNGGTLGFGLRHLYPFPKTWSSGDVEPLTSLKAWLKGSDAALMHACHAHGLHPALQLLHEEHWGDRRGLRSALFDQMPVVDSAGDGEWIDRQLLHYYGATRMYRVDLFETTAPKKVKHMTRKAEETPQSDEEYEPPENKLPRKTATVHMLTDVTSNNRIKNTYAAYGNEASMDIMYVGMCLIVDIGPAGQRDNVDADRWRIKRSGTSEVESK